MPKVETIGDHDSLRKSQFLVYCFFVCGVLLFAGYELWCIVFHVSTTFGTNLCLFVLYFGGVL
jgi:hypothetical protein